MKKSKTTKSKGKVSPSQSEDKPEDSLFIKKRHLEAANERMKAFKNAFNESYVEQIPSRLEMYKPILTEYKSVLEKLELLNSSYVFDEDLLIFETEYFDNMSFLKNKILEPEKIQQPSTIINQTTSTLNDVKLPIIKLPTFNGDPRNWVTFKDNFESLIHNKENLPDSLKLNYLKSSVTQSALDLINNLPITDANYTIAWNILKNRFSNKRIISQSHVRTLLELPAMKNNSFQELNTLYVEFSKQVQALKALGKEIDASDFLLVPLLCSKLDQSIMRKWEEHLPSNCESPTLTELESFILKQLNVIQVSKNNNTCSKFSKPTTNLHNKSYQKPQNTENYSFASTSKYYKPQKNSYQKFNNNNHKFNPPNYQKDNIKCLICPEKNAFHRLYFCPEFNKLTPKQRLAKAFELNICRNCLNNSHATKDCKTEQGCKVCNLKHSTLLHLDPQQLSEVVRARPTDVSQNHIVSMNESSSSTTLLATAVVELKNKEGCTIQARALIDSGAQDNFISECLVQLLHLDKKKVSLPIKGITDNTEIINHSVSAVVQSLSQEYRIPLNFLVLKKIIENLPQRNIDISSWCIPNSVTLSDPQFYKPNKIDLLLGAEIAFDILQEGVIRLGPDKPVMRQSSFGWLVSGKCVFPLKNKYSNRNLPSVTCLTVEYDHHPDLDSSLTKFWEIEDLTKPKTLTSYQKEVENLFINTTTRNSDGRYIMHLPFKKDHNTLGQSYELALKRVQSLNTRLQRDPNLWNQYDLFIQEYLQLGHMEEVSSSELAEIMQDDHYFIPHREVIREDSLSTKLRVVFNASMPTTNGVSLNDILEVGPPLQVDIFNILLKVRFGKYMLIADIEKMFRQFLIYPPHTKFQLILWIKPDKTLVVYRLLTVTYGTACAPYLSQRALKQLAEDEKDHYPLAAACLQEDIYVDDLITSVSSEKHLYDLHGELTQISRKGGLKFRKWGSNNQNFINSINQETDPLYTHDLSADSGIKTLGMHWLPIEDSFIFRVNLLQDAIISKRSILSTISKLYDPLGIVGPVVIKAKIFIQSLWLCKLQWDEPLPPDLTIQWTTFSSDLPALNNFKVTRYIADSPEIISYELHGFCDASEVAYAACVYLKVSYINSEPTSYLLCSKSRVAPIKKLTIPRLELCGALLLSRLVSKVLETLKNFKIDKIFYWTDSTIVLNWIAADSNRWKTFVCNRISEIQETTHLGTWMHVSTTQNPADLASRGLSATKFLELYNFWINGPKFILENKIYEKPNLELSRELPEEKPNNRLILITVKPLEPNLNEVININKFKSWKTLFRTFALVKRFISNLKSRTKNLNPLTVDELLDSQRILINYYQLEMFSDEIKTLMTNKTLNPTNRLISLSPFLDKDNLLRVGGRLENAEISFNQKHPYLLDSNHYLTQLIVEYYHLKHFHAGPQHLLYLVRQRFWPIHGKNLCKQIVHKCIICFRVKPKTHSYLMGDLPKSRVTVSPPFKTTGLDFAGPINYKLSSAKSSKIIKCYICIFVCFSTRAIHLELVSDLTSQAFLACFRRFSSRRGLPLHVHCDNASNFVKASKDLKSFIDHSLSKTVNDIFSEDNITFHFTPVYSPTFAGIWESGVKSMKFHLRRAVGYAPLTFEELATLLSQIEACLNSRPISPCSTDPSDLSALTPGHFLIGRPLTLPPEPKLDDRFSLLTRWQKIQWMYNYFWKRWQKEFLSQQQQRYKWRKDYLPLQEGTLVLLTDESLPPLRWALGRIIQLHPGKDGVTRVASVKLANGKSTTRAVTRMCPLPLPAEETQFNNLPD